MNVVKAILLVAGAFVAFLVLSIIGSLLSVIFLFVGAVILVKVILDEEGKNEKDPPN